MRKGHAGKLLACRRIEEWNLFWMAVNEIRGTYARGCGQTISSSRRNSPPRALSWRRDALLHLFNLKTAVDGPLAGQPLSRQEIARKAVATKWEAGSAPQFAQKTGIQLPFLGSMCRRRESRRTSSAPRPGERSKPMASI